MEFKIKSIKRQELINITGIIRKYIYDSGIKDGIAFIFVPHTTAGITINENADPDVVKDILSGLKKIAPEDDRYLHMEGNSDAHIKASLMGSSCSVIIEGGELKLGTWQGIYFCEFDGPRERKVYVKVLKA